MKKSLTAAAIAVALTCADGAQVYINEVLPNAPGNDTGNEFFELRGAPNLLLTNYYLISLEGQGGGKGDINQYFDLGAFSLGANGYLFGRQASSRFDPVDAGATLIENTFGTTGFGTNNASTMGYWSDNVQADLENSATTILLVHVGSGEVPVATSVDMDTNNDGYLDLPAGWTLVDSVGIMDGASALETDMTYGAINFRVEGQPGTSEYGNIIDVPGPMTTTAGTFWVGRKGESTGSTSEDWFGSILNGSASNPTAFYFYSASDQSYNGRLVSEMIYGGMNPAPDPAGTVGYVPTIHSTRFTNHTSLTVGGTVGAAAVDPRDNTTILFASDSALGAIYRARKVASGNWAVDPTPVVSGLDRPSGLAISANGTLWWVHDVTMSVIRLRAPWESNTPEMVVTNFGTGTADDDPIDLTIAPTNFSGLIGQPGWLVIADRGNDADTQNALLTLDPATSELNQQLSNFLAPPTTSGLGWDNLNAVASLPQSGEVVSLSLDGFIVAVNADGAQRGILPTTLWPLGSTPAGAALAVDPTTGRIWLADDTLDEVWSVDPAATGQTPDRKELSFPLTDPLKTYRAIDIHDPGMTFAPDGSFLVVSDSSTAGGGGRLVIFHSEPIVTASFSVTGTMTTEGFRLDWESAGSAGYSVLRSTNAADPAGFQPIASDLTSTHYTDPNPPMGQAFYRVVAQP